MTPSPDERRAAKIAALRAVEPERDWQTAISIHNLNHHFGEGELRKQVLHNNNLDIYAGQIVIMTGPSGSGKTTLLTLIGTLRTVQEGSLKVLGRELLAASPDELVAARRNVGFIFQAHNLFGSLTAHQNVRMAMELFDYTDQQMNDRAAELLTRLGLEKRMHYKPSRLSGGQKQRVAIARGLAHRPKIVLADEPTAALDEESGKSVIQLFKEVADHEGVSILLVTHDKRILEVADQVVHMVDGRIVSSTMVRETELIVKFLREANAFATLPTSVLADIADRMWVEQYRTGQTIIREGDPGENFYLIRKGNVRVSRQDHGEEKTLATLGPGACFGEASLMTGAPRNATVTATDEVFTFVLSKDDFTAAVKVNETLKQQLQRILFERH
jgi:putative ABC transport system ATP-binding protein